MRDQQDIESVKCKTCIHEYPNVNCVNCGVSHYNYIPLTTDNLNQSREDQIEYYRESAIRLAIIDGISNEELEVWTQAHRDEHLIIIPCRIGDTLYDIFEYIENRSSPEICEYTVDSIKVCKDKHGIYYVIDSTNFRPEDFGKTVFLSLEAAKNALIKASKRYSDEYHKILNELKNSPDYKKETHNQNFATSKHSTTL